MILTNLNDMVCSVCGCVHEKENKIGLYNCTYCAGLDTDKYIILNIDIKCTGFCENCILNGSCKNQEKANQEYENDDEIMRIMEEVDYELELNIDEHEDMEAYHNWLTEREEAREIAEQAGYDSGVFDEEDAE